MGELTPSEMRVLDLVAAGLNNAQIASKLGIRPKTVRNHINHIFDKLACRIGRVPLSWLVTRVSGCPASRR